MDDVKSVVCHTAMMKSCIIWMRAGVITIDMHQIRPVRSMQTQGVGSLGKGSTGKAAGNRNTSSGREKIRPAKTKKHSKLGILWVIIIILAGSCTTGWRSGWFIKKQFSLRLRIAVRYRQIPLRPQIRVHIFTAGMMSRDTRDYSIGAGYGPAQAGVQFEAGKYGVFTSSAEVTLTVTRKKADNEQYTLKDGEDTLFLTFEEGDTIQVESEEEWLRQCLSDGVGRLRNIV